MEFWFELASTYSYLAAARIEAAARDAGIPIAWKPFLLGPIFRAQGWNDSPFNLYPVKGAYMWRDVERTCRALGLPFRRPTVFPRNGLLAARVSLVAANEPWAPELVRALYRANFGEDRDIADPGVVASVLEGVGADPASVFERAGSQANKDALRRQTEEAAAKGIFGAPTFVVDGELFWGNDRLEDALREARHVAA